MVLVLKILGYEILLGILLVALPFWAALSLDTRLDVLLLEGFQLTGLLLAALGGVLWLWATVVLARSGRGTPLPLDPPRLLVVDGPYALLRNPMHVGLVALLAGVALLFRSPSFVLYAGLIAGLIVLYVRRVEEPELARRFGEAYGAYRARVPAWWPFRGVSLRAPSFH